MFEIGKDCVIDETATINVKHGRLGDRSIVKAHATIEGNEVWIGNEAFVDVDAWIGGGSCFDKGTRLEAGDWLHMGRGAHINFARPTFIGHEFGCGMASRVFSHGAYPPAWEGFPAQWAGCTIGDRVWLPHAWVNPGVTIGSDVVVAAMSLVNGDLPPGCLAGGIPAKVLREGLYPRKLNARERYALWQDIFGQTIAATGIIGGSWGFLDAEVVKVNNATLFDLGERTIAGPATLFTEALKNQLRRNGIRFRYVAKNGEYVSWDEY